MNDTLIYSCIENHHYKELENYLKEEFKLKTNEQTGQRTLKKLTAPEIKVFEHILSIKTEENDEYFSLIRQCYICLRNGIAVHKTLQNELTFSSEIIDISKKLLELTTENEECFTVILQFLGNLVVNNKETQELVWNKFQQFLLHYFRSEKPNKIPSVISMILYNIFLSNPSLIPTDESLLIQTLVHFEDEVDYAELILELLIKNNRITSTNYNKLKLESRIVLLQFLHDLVPNAETANIPVELIQMLSNEFKMKSDYILKTNSDYLNKIDVFEVVNLLEVIATASSIEYYQVQLQTDKSLLINCSFLLKGIHSCGKSDENDFTAVQKLSELTLQEDRSIRENPYFGFKATLIRTIGNLCWKHSSNQNLVRELECIPVLLDCCNIDAKNPFIIQCVILTIRSLCESNLENQAVIASMTKIGVVNSEVLLEMGLVLNDDGENKLCVLPYEKK